jgi:hypothetical protein
VSSTTCVDVDEGVTSVAGAINGAMYYQCGTTWYSRGYVNGNVNYVVVPKPVF